MPPSRTTGTASWMTIEYSKSSDSVRKQLAIDLLGRDILVVVVLGAWHLITHQVVTCHFSLKPKYGPKATPGCVMGSPGREADLPKYPGLHSVCLDLWCSSSCRGCICRHYSGHRSRDCELCRCVVDGVRIVVLTLMWKICNVSSQPASASRTMLQADGSMTA